MMVLCFLMSIPLKMMAQDKVEVVSHYKQGDVWKENPNFVLTKTDGEIYTWVLKDVPEADANRGIFFRIKVGSTEYGPQSKIEDLKLASSYQQIYPISWKEPKALKIEATSGTSYTITYNHKTKEIKYDVSEGGSTGSGSEGSSGSTTVEWDTENINRLKDKPRVYTQGFYLAGNFFSFSDPNKVTYDDAVFKFQQQKNKEIDGTDYDVYKVEIPASLAAHAQVMYVNEVGKIADVLGPGIVKKINNVYPVTDTETDWAALKANESSNLKMENNNYWDFYSRNVSATDYSDGMYELYIA